MREKGFKTINHNFRHKFVKGMAKTWVKVFNHFEALYFREKTNEGLDKIFKYPKAEPVSKHLTNIIIQQVPHILKEYGVKVVGAGGF